MNEFKEVSPREASDIFNMIGSDWMLISASDGGRTNCMTASWGCAGVLWNLPVCICFVRPQRYTRELIEASDTLSLSFFEEEYRSSLSLCGKITGRKADKFSAARFTPVNYGDTPYVNEAKKVLICRKLYADDLREDKFFVPELLKHYPGRDFHRFYVCGVEKVFVRK